jgi:5-methylthioadenosine/S-adenosylhomocysteine deaminase
MRLLLVISLVLASAMTQGCRESGAQHVHGVRLVIDNALIFSMDPGHPEPFVGYMAIAPDGTIRAIGPSADSMSTKGSEYLSATHVNAAGKWLLPGFVSAHSHLWQSEFTGIAQNENLEGWIDQLYGNAAPKLALSDFYALTLRGAEHHLDSGITTAFNFSYSGADTSGLVDRCQLRAALDAGMRVVHGFNIRLLNDQWTVAEARERMRTFLLWARAQPEQAQYLGTMISGAGAYTDNPAQTQSEALFMREFDVKNQQHYLESPGRSAAERARYPIMKQAGMIGPNLIFGHFVHATPQILADASQAGVSMVWNPLSNGRLGSGVPDIVGYRKQGLHIGMGVDGEASADRADPFENMRMGLYQVRAVRQDASALTPYEVLQMHTLGSAQVLGLQDRLGSLAVGKYADFILLNPKRLIPYKDPYAAIVFAGAVDQIDSIYVGGHKVRPTHHNILRHKHTDVSACS